MDEFKEDATDRKLREMFAQRPLADGGFSDRVVRQVQHHARRRRLLIMLAVVPGTFFAAQPLMEIANKLALLATRLGGGLSTAVEPLVAVQSGMALPLASALLVFALFAFRLLEE